LDGLALCDKESCLGVFLCGRFRAPLSTEYLSIFVTSLTFDAFSYKYQGVQIMTSFVLLMGSIAILGGGLLEWVIGWQILYVLSQYFV
jgi:hypothetical protein